MLKLLTLLNNKQGITKVKKQENNNYYPTFKKHN